MNIGVITTSRADYGIYHSLLECMRRDPTLEYGLLVAGSHLSERHGYTVHQIEEDGHPIYGRVEAVPTTTTPVAIATVMGRTVTACATLWNELKDSLDLIVALGDRYEMFAAVAAAVPYNIPVAHLHGGEITLGAIDDKFRHALTVMSTLHFTATPVYAKRVANIVGSRERVYAFGSPSLDGLADIVLPSLVELREKFGIDFTSPTILVTFHPETIAVRENAGYAEELSRAFDALTQRYQVVINLPNADTHAGVIRTAFEALAARNPRIVTLENFGKYYYFAALNAASFLIGNSSSALLEAPSFGKFAVNVGDRQRGRERNPNIIDVPVETSAILAAVGEIEKRGLRYEAGNIYHPGPAVAPRIVAALKKWYREQKAVS